MISLQVWQLAHRTLLLLKLVGSYHVVDLNCYIVHTSGQEGKGDQCIDEHGACMYKIKPKNLLFINAVYNVLNKHSCNCLSMVVC